MRKFTFRKGNSDKYWEIALNGKTCEVHYGRTGTEGIRHKKEFTTAEEAKLSYQKNIADKLKKGYTEVGSKDAERLVDVIPVQAPPLLLLKKLQGLEALNEKDRRKPVLNQLVALILQLNETQLIEGENEPDWKLHVAVRPGALSFMELLSGLNLLTRIDQDEFIEGWTESGILP